MSDTPRPATHMGAESQEVLGSPDRAEAGHCSLGLLLGAEVLVVKAGSLGVLRGCSGRAAALGGEARAAFRGQEVPPLPSPLQPRSLRFPGWDESNQEQPWIHPI